MSSNSVGPGGKSISLGQAGAMSGEVKDSCSLYLKQTKIIKYFRSHLGEKEFHEIMGLVLRFSDEKLGYVYEKIEKKGELISIINDVRYRTASQINKNNEDTEI
jgi:hypothetical protein